MSRVTLRLHGGRGRESPYVLVSVIILMVTACGSPTTPSPPPAPDRLLLREGPQFVFFGGFGISSDPLFPPCVPLGVPRSGTIVVTQVNLEHLGAEWVARSPSPTFGSLEIRLRDSGGSHVEGIPVTGTIRGSAVDQGQGGRPAQDVTVTLTGDSGNAALEGVSNRSVFFTMGRIAGTIRFADSQNEASTCTAIQWNMQPTTGFRPTLAFLIPGGA